MPRTDKPYTTERSSPLAKLRVRAKLSRAAAADALDLAVGSLANIERGQARASDDLLEQMEDVYGVSRQAVQRAYAATRREFMVREKP